MPFTEQDKAALSDIVEAFTLAIVEVCQTLDHQKILASVAFIKELDLRAANLPTDASGKMKRNILTNISKVLSGQPYSSGSLSEGYDSASRKVA